MRSCLQTAMRRRHVIQSKHVLEQSPGSPQCPSILRSDGQNTGQSTGKANRRVDTNVEQRMVDRAWPFDTEDPFLGEDGLIWRVLVVCKMSIHGDFVFRCCERPKCVKGWCCSVGSVCFTPSLRAELSVSWFIPSEYDLP
jgi:hypothetical protein